MGFIDRQAELEVMLSGLSSPIGPHFWLVVAHPGLGKSKFLKFMRAGLETRSHDWEVRSIDVSRLGDPLRSKPTALVARFFTQELGDAAEPDIAGRVAKGIVADGGSYLCLLDSAELLNEQDVAGIRRYFSEIYQLTGAWAGGEGAGRVALVVASRLDGVAGRAWFRRPDSGCCR